jgi:outer membrane protein insertion porin family
MSPPLPALAVLAAWLSPQDATPVVVAAVRIEAPAAEVERLSRYLEVSPGRPLSAEAVRHTVELFYATGQYDDVIVETVQGAEGLTLSFRPVPAPLLEELRVEGDRVLDPAALRRLTGLRPREPLWRARLERAARDVAVALAADGYLEAQASAEARPLGRGAAAVFTLRSGPRVRVSSAAVRPAGFAETALRDLVAPRPGAVFQRALAQRAAEKMRRRLVDQGRWGAAVELREAFDPTAATLALVFEVAPGPIVRLGFSGERPAPALRRRVEKLLRDGGLKTDALEAAAELLEDDYRARGYRDVAVVHREEPGGADALAVTYGIDTGSQAFVASVQLVGAPQALPELALATRAGAPFEDRKVEEDARALKRLLEERGHAEARVEPEVAEGGGQLPVVFRLRPGPSTVVASIAVEAAGPLPLGTARELRVKQGLAYRIQDVAADRAEVLAGCRAAGYLQAEVTPEVGFSEDRSQAHVVLRVALGPRTPVGRVVVTGLEHSREIVVRRELALAPGDPLSLQELLESQRRLSALGIFRRVSIAEIDPDSAADRSLVVTVEEGPRSSVAYGLGYAERELLRVSAEVTRRNLAGMDRSLSAYVRASFSGSRALLTYREPYLRGRKRELFATAFREEDDRESFDFVSFGGVVQSVFSLRAPLTAILRYTYQLTRVFNVEVPLEEIDRQFQSSTFSGPAFSLVNDTRDDQLDPRRGRFASADVQLSLRVLGGDSFVKAFSQVSVYRRVSASMLAALGGRLGLARTLGRDEPLRVPLPDRFFAGGDYSLRGFATDTVGPRELTADGRLVPTGGNALLLGSLELRRDLGRNFSLAAFSDAGNVYSLASAISLADVRYSAGLGLRYRSALGPLRVDWGYKLNRRAGESPYRFHVTIGHAF